MVMWWHLKVVTSRECGFSQTQGCVRKLGGFIHYNVQYVIFIVAYIT